MEAVDPHLTPKQVKLLEIHGNEDCYICGRPRASEGGMACSYPHGRLPIQPVDPENPKGFWTWASTM